MKSKVEAAYYREEDEDYIATIEDGRELASITGSTVASAWPNRKNLQLSIITNPNNDRLVASLVT